MTVCGSSTAIAASELTAESKPATQYTIDANQEVYALLDFEDTAEFENATKGLLASPDTANPSLWRNTQLNHIYGLFEVTDGIYQARDGNAWAEYMVFPGDRVVELGQKDHAQGFGARTQGEIGRAHV